MLSLYIKKVRQTLRVRPGLHFTGQTALVRPVSHLVPVCAFTANES